MPKLKPLLQVLPSPGTERNGWPWTVETDPAIYSSGTEWPLVTIVTPSFNQGEFIEETIRSVLLQNYPHLEYFIFDGGSTDGTLDILRKYDQWITYWVSEDDSGQGSAINKGFQMATGDILAWLNSDDVYYQNALRTIMAEVTRLPAHVAYVGACDKVNTKGQILSTVKPRNLHAPDIADWYGSGFFYQPACFFRRSAFEETGGINESYQNAMDVDLWVRLALMGSFAKIDATVAHAKIYDDMKTLKYAPLRDAETVAVAITHGYREAALNRLAAYARYYVRNEMSVRCLAKALAAKFRGTLKDIFSGG